MKLILKYIILNIKDKKMRTLLIITSIMFASGLFYASNSMSNTLVQIYEQNFKRAYGNSDIIVYAKSKDQNKYIDKNKVNLSNNEMQYASILKTFGVIKTKEEFKNFNIYGIELNEFDKINPIPFKYSISRKFEGKQVIIGEDIAEELNLKVNDFIKIKINGIDQILNIYGISENKGIFKQDVFVNYIIMPMDFLQSFLNLRGKISIVMIKLNDKELKEEISKKLKLELNDLVINEPYSQEDVNNQVKKIVLPFKFISILVIIISMYIIYSSYRVLIYQRLPVIGTFRSLGASSIFTNIIFIIESLIYGIIGAIFGVFLGQFFLFLIIKSQVTYLGDNNLTIDINYKNVVLIFLISIFISIVSSILPMLKVIRFSLKDIILNRISNNIIKYKLKTMIALLLMISTIVLYNIKFMIPEMYKGIIIMMILIIVVILIIPFYTIFFTFIIEKIIPKKLYKGMWVAIRNLRTNRNLINNISLLGIGISCLIFVNSLSLSIEGSINREFDNNMNFQVYMIPYVQLLKNFENSLNSIDGINDSYGVNEIFDVNIKNKNDKIKKLVGIDSKKHGDFVLQSIYSNVKDPIKELDKERNIIISTMLRNKYKLNYGDVLQIEGNKKSYNYSIIGFVDTIENNGDFGMISNKYFTTDMNVKYVNTFYLKIKNGYEIKEVIKKIRSSFSNKQFVLLSINDIKQKYLSSYKQIFDIINWFSIIVIIISFIGIINNVVVSYIERERTMSLLMSIGMSKKDSVIMIINEAIFGGIIGSVSGCIVSVVLLNILPEILSNMDIYITNQVSIKSLVLSFFLGFILMIFASISSCIRIFRFNIVSSIKFD